MMPIAQPYSFRESRVILATLRVYLKARSDRIKIL
jgi:hypothetical protein